MSGQSDPWKQFCPLILEAASKRMGATVVEVESSHVPMLSKPDVVIEVIRKAAKAIQEHATA